MNTEHNYLQELLKFGNNVWRCTFGFAMQVESSSLHIAPPSTAILGHTGGGGTGNMVRIIHSGRAMKSGLLLDVVVQEGGG